MKIEKSETWVPEAGLPTDFLVKFWEDRRGGEPLGAMDNYLLGDASVDEVLRWAQEKSVSGTFEVFVVAEKSHEAPGGVTGTSPCLYRIYGVDTDHGTAVTVVSFSD